jgi:hypothetical protein
LDVAAMPRRRKTRTKGGRFLEKVNLPMRSAGWCQWSVRQVLEGSSAPMTVAQASSPASSTGVPPGGYSTILRNLSNSPIAFGGGWYLN